MSFLNSLFGAGSQELLGLDISSSAVKLLELSRHGEKFQVECYAIEPLPPGAVIDRQIADPRTVGDCIARAVSRAGTGLRQVALGVSGASVITKIVQLPSNLSEFDIEEQIKAQADAYIPYPIEDVNLDFQINGASDKGSGMSDVTLAACRKEQVEQRCAAAEMAGLTPKVVDVEAYALENACQFLRHQMPDKGVKKTVAVVDVGASVTSLLVLHDLHAVYTRDQAFGGRSLIEELMRQYGMSFEEASVKRRAGELPESYEAELLPAFVADMAQQIDRSLQFFFAASAKHASADQIILAGGCAHIPDAARMVEERLRIPAVLARPFSEMSITARARPTALAREEASLLTACGLAFRAFDPPR